MESLKSYSSRFRQHAANMRNQQEMKTMSTDQLNIMETVDFKK